jgi:hypothetical protein
VTALIGRYSLQAELRFRLKENIELFQNPILSALEGCGLSALEVGIVWIDLEEQVQQAHDEALQKGSIKEAIIAAHQKRQEIAARLLAAREGISQ